MKRQAGHPDSGMTLSGQVFYRQTRARTISSSTTASRTLLTSTGVRPACRRRWMGRSASSIIIENYRGWHVATTGFPDARGRANELPITFHELIWQIAREAGLEFRSKEHSYLLELTGPHNRVVVAHQRSQLTLLGIRHNGTGDWVQREARGHYLAGDYPVAREFPLRSFAEILATFAAFSPLQQEGYVVVDGAGRRVKVKHPGYVAIHLLKS